MSGREAPPPRAGGSSVAVVGATDGGDGSGANLAATLARLGDAVSLVVPEPPATPVRPGVEVVVSPALDVEVTPGFLASSYRLYRALRGGSWDAIVFEDRPGAAYCTARAKQFGVDFAGAKLVVRCREPILRRAERERRSFLSKAVFGAAMAERLALELADAVWCDDDGQLAWLQAQGWSLSGALLTASEDLHGVLAATSDASREPGPPDGDEPPLVSVVVAHHERPEVLSLCLDGVARQSYPALEVVVADDGSSSRGAVAVLAELESRTWPWPLRILRLPPGGVASARNAGWRAASGELVVFLDDDDVPFDDLVEAAVHGRAASRADVVVAGARFFEGDGAPVPRAGDVVRVPLGEPHEFGLLGNHYGGPTCLWPRRLLDRLGGFREVRVEDWELLARAAMDGARIVPSPDPLHWYRRSSTSRDNVDPDVRRSEAVKVVADLFAQRLPPESRLLPLLAAGAYEELERRKRASVPRRRRLAERGRLLARRARQLHADEGLLAVATRTGSFVLRSLYRGVVRR